MNIDNLKVEIPVRFKEKLLAKFDPELKGGANKVSCPLCDEYFKEIEHIDKKTKEKMFTDSCSGCPFQKFEKLKNNGVYGIKFPTYGCSKWLKRVIFPNIQKDETYTIIIAYNAVASYYHYPGCIEAARKILRQLHEQAKNLVTWV